MLDYLGELFFLIVGSIAVILYILRNHIKKQQFNRTPNDKKTESYERLIAEYEKTKTYPHPFSDAQIVTGDHYSDHLIGQDDHFNYSRCLHAGTATCANCARRSEYYHDNIYTYGMGANCKNREMDFYDLHMD